MPLPLEHYGVIEAMRNKQCSIERNLSEAEEQL